MFEILSFLSSVKYFIVAGVIAFVAFFGWWQKKKIEARDKTIEGQKEAIEVYKTKDEINKQDDVIDTKVEEEKKSVEEKVDGKDPKDAAEVISGVLNDYFGDKSSDTNK